MGNVSTGLSHKLHPDTYPGPNQPSKFDPLYGFPEGRKEKGIYWELHHSKYLKPIYSQHLQIIEYVTSILVFRRNFVLAFHKFN